MAAEESVAVKFGAQIEGLTAGINSVIEKIESITAPVQGVMDSFAKLQEAIIVAFAVERVSKFIEHIAEMGEQIERASVMTGLSADQFQTLQFAMKMTGGSGDNLGQTMMRMSRNIETAVGKAGPARSAFEELGVSLSDLKTKSPYEILQLMADGFSKIKDPIQAMADATIAGGRGIGELFVALHDGSESLDKYKAKLDETNSKLNEAQVQGFSATAHSVTLLGQSVSGVGVQAFRLFKPVIDGVVDGLTFLANRVSDVLKLLADLANVVEGVAAEIMVSLTTGVVGAAEYLGEGFKELYIRSSQYIGDIGTAVKTLATILNDWVHGDFSKAKDDLVAGFAEIASAGVKADKEIAQSQLDLGKTMAGLGSAWSMLTGKIAQATLAMTSWGKAQKEASELANRHGIGGEKDKLDKNTGESEEMQIEKNNLTTEEDLAKIALQRKKDVLAQEVSDHQISKQQELAQEMVFVSENEKIELAAVDKYAALYDEDTVQYAEAQNKKKIIVAQANEQIEKLTAQSASVQAHQYDQVFQSIERASSQAVNGILQGTQTWQQALQRTFSSILAVFVDDLVVKRVGKWLEGEAMMLTGTQAKNAAVVASDAAANDAGLASMASKAFQAITTDAAQAFGGVFAFLAPEMGPAAAGPAAGASAAVLAAASSIPSFDVGSWELPSDTLAMVHKGEMIIPAAQAAGIRDGTAGVGGSSGGDSYNVNISVSSIDAQSGGQWLMQNSGVIAQAVASQIRNGNTALRNSMR